MKVGAAIFFDLHPYIVAPIGATDTALLSSYVLRQFLDDSDVTMISSPLSTKFNHMINVLIIFIVPNFFYTVSPDAPLALQWVWLAYETSITLIEFYQERLYGNH